LSIRASVRIAIDCTVLFGKIPLNPANSGGCIAEVLPDPRGRGVGQLIGIDSRASGGWRRLSAADKKKLLALV